MTWRDWNGNIITEDNVPFLDMDQLPDTAFPDGVQPTYALQSQQLAICPIHSFLERGQKGERGGPQDPKRGKGAPPKSKKGRGDSLGVRIQ